MSSYQAPPINKAAAARHAKSARLGRATPTGGDLRDGVGLATNVAALAQYYRESFLPSPLGAILTSALASRDGRFSKTAKTGDWGNLVDLK